MEPHSTQIDSPKPKKKFPGWVFWGAPGLLLVLVAVYFLLPPRIPFPSPPVKLPSGNFAPQFRISRETTVITSPLDEEGYPDYEAAVNEKYGAGIDPKQNMVVGLMAAFGQKPATRPIIPRFFQLLKMPIPPEKGDYLISFIDFLKSDTSLTETQRREVILPQFEKVTNGPWKSATYPWVSKWLKFNEKPLEKVVEASRMPQYYFPVVYPLKGKDPTESNGLFPLETMWLLDLPNYLICRAWQKLGDGDSLGAKEDLLACRRIIQKIPLVTLGDFLTRSPMEGLLIQAEQKFLQVCGFNKEQLVLWKKEIDATRKSISINESFDWCFRYGALDAAIKVNHFSANILKSFPILVVINGDPIKKERILDVLDTESLDWDWSLKVINRGMDGLFSVLKISNYLDREREIKKFNKEWGESVVLKIQEGETLKKGYWEDSKKRKFMAELLATMILDFQCGFSAESFIIDRIDELNRIFDISLALAIFHKANGFYPESLKELSPDFLKDIPLDFYSDGPHRYRKTGNGYLLYSVGSNGIDEQGTDTLSGDPPGDDIVVRVPLSSAKNDAASGK